MAEHDAAARLSELENYMRAPDAIMEDRIASMVAEYLSAGGQPQAAIESLSEHYTGYAEMAGLVCSWLAGPAADAAATAPAPDEFELLKALVQERFDSERFSEVFANAQGPPVWLSQLTSDGRGRKLLYELSAVHKNCLLLNFAMQRILYEGHAEEVASVGSSLASYFAVFHRLLASRLAACAEATAEKQLLQIAHELADSCCQSVHTYIHAQQMLHELAAQPGGRPFRRISQELQLAAARISSATQRNNISVFSLEVLLLPHDVSSALQQATGLVAAVLSSSYMPLAAAAGQAASTPAPVLQRLARCSQELQQLLALYSSAAAPELQTLQQPLLLELLLQCVFPAAGQQVPPELAALSLSLLALAVGSRQEAGGGGLDRSGGEGARSSLKAAARVVQRACQGLRLTQDDLAVAAQAAHMRVVALGWLHSIGSYTSQREFHSEDRAAPAYSACLLLLEHVVELHPHLHARVVALLRASLLAMGSSKGELVVPQLELLVRLLARGQVGPVMGCMEAWSSSNDASLARHFVMRVLELVAPPFSQQFAAQMLRLMHSCMVRRLKEGPQGLHMGKLLREFAGAASQLKFQPPLHQREAALMQELQSWS